MTDETLIRQAFRRDDHTEVAQLLAAHPEFKQQINEKGGDFGAPAITSVKSREMLDVLLASGADINARSDWWAGGFGILDMAPPDIAHYAIEKGARLDTHAAARLGMHDALVQLIDSDPQLVHAKGGDGQTPLHFASTVDVAAYLLDKGADIDAKDVDHVSTPAQYMVRDRQEVCRYLVSRGCKTDILMAAALNDKPLVDKILDEDPDAIRMRVSDEYFPMISGENGGTIYQWTLGWYVSAHQVALDLGHEQLFDHLMSRSPEDVRVMTRCWLGEAPSPNWFVLGEGVGGEGKWQAQNARQIAHAARNNNLLAVRAMLVAGLSPNARSQHGGTTLHWAAWHGNTEMIRLLLGHGAVLDDRENQYNAPPVGWAIHASENGWDPGAGDFPGTVEMLLKSGASPPEKQSGTPEIRAVLAAHGVPA